MGNVKAIVVAAAIKNIPVALDIPYCLDINCLILLGRMDKNNRQPKDGYWIWGILRKR